MFKIGQNLLNIIFFYLGLSLFCNIYAFEGVKKVIKYNEIPGYSSLDRNCSGGEGTAYSDKSFNECIDMCNQDQQCKAVDFRFANNSCSLKYSNWVESSVDEPWNCWLKTN